MNINQTWSIRNIECTRAYDDSIQSSNKIHWKLTTQNTDGYVYTVTQLGAVEVSLTPEQCVGLSPEDALSIAKNKLGDSVAILEASGIEQLNQMMPVVEE